MMTVPKNIDVLAATKTRKIDEIKHIIGSGIKRIGENRIQEAEEKYCQLKDFLKENGVEFHFIGHLQKNKVKKAMQMFDVIQSIDSIGLAEEINKEAKKIDKVQEILIQVNIGEEPQKSGIKKEGLRKMLEDIFELKNIRVRGLMCIAPDFEDKEKTRPYFIEMKKLFEKSKIHLKQISSGGFKGVLPISKKENKFSSNVTSEVSSDVNDFNILSMGMSEDYTIAIEEGSTMIRLGRALFGPRE
ncbi:MAG: YggS family pyridoxal phosphate-dependent enzyme [Candidatus Woesearchaeota archaeon]|nr:YggS family pyridoxal phosphate-dependent enzyme [Candidatus Woesearchaeota archaeon]